MMALAGVAAASNTPERRAVHQIRTEAIRQPSDGYGQPLPLSGVFTVDYIATAPDTATTPGEQIALIQAGHRLLPAFSLKHSDVFFLPTQTAGDTLALNFVKDNKLPLVFISTQPERLFYEQTRYSAAAFASNPLLHSTPGQSPGTLIDPLGPVGAWQALATDWLDNSHIAEWSLETFYPDPPFVIWYSNNEANRADWNNADTSYRYEAAYGTGTSADLRRLRYGDGFVANYRAFFDKVRTDVVAGWSDLRFVGYNAGAIAYAGRWSGWVNEPTSLHSGSGAGFRFDPLHECWDGSSPQSYLDHWRTISDYQVYSVQVEDQNNRACLDEALALKPDYWIETISWDGHLPGNELDKRAWFSGLTPSQTYSAARYQGMIQFTMWLQRPRVVREYRNHGETQETIGAAYFEALLDAVDAVHTNVTLRRFWRHGTMVENTAEDHPWLTALPTELAALPRWWMLTASVNPAQPYTDNTTELLVLSVAYVIGASPSRQWMVYAHSPRQARTGVGITVPGYGAITVDVSVEGSFFLVDEAADNTYLQFDGSNDYALTASSIAPSGDFTAAVRCSHNRANAANYPHAIGSHGAESWGIYFAEWGPAYIGFIIVGGVTYEINMGPKAAVNNLAIIRSGSNLYGYNNGVLYGPIAASASAIGSTGNFILGNSNAGVDAGGAWPGPIYRAGVWNGTALALGQLDTYFASAADSGSPTSAWLINERTGTTLSDAIGAKDLTVSGAAWGGMVTPA